MAGDAAMMRSGNGVHLEYIAISSFMLLPCIFKLIVVPVLLVTYDKNSQFHHK